MYAYAAEDSSAYLKKGQLQLTDDSALPLVNDQIREEYARIPALYAGTIQAEVVDFDFRYIVTFLNRLSAVELNTLPNIAALSTRKIEITLSISPMEEWEFIDSHLLKRWLNRANHPTKKGTQLKFMYVRGAPVESIPKSKHDLLIYGIHHAWSLALRKWRKVVDVFVKSSENGRAKDEAKMIQAVL
jgi:hypothetical protein